MKNFYGFELLRLIRAIGNINDPDNSYSYEVEHFNVFGERKVLSMRVREVDNKFGRLRISGERCAVLEYGVSRFISEIEYKDLTTRYGVVT
jgi:hypothetical protein